MEKLTLPLVEVQQDQDKTVFTFLDRERGEIRDVTFNSKKYNPDKNSWDRSEEQEAKVEEMAVFEEQIRGLALAMPLAVGELANVAALAGQLGIAQEDIAGFTETMAMLGTATNLSAEEAGNALARFQNVTGTSVDTVENLGSAIVHLGNNFATQESEIINLAINE